MKPGTLAEVLKGADVFIGVSAAGCVTQDMVRSMNENPIPLSMANPTPEIMPDLAKRSGEQQSAEPDAVTSRTRSTTYCIPWNLPWSVRCKSK